MQSGPRHDERGVVESKAEPRQLGAVQKKLNVALHQAVAAPAFARNDVYRVGGQTAPRQRL